jgi:hypothetical protein
MRVISFTRRTENSDRCFSRVKILHSLWHGDTLEQKGLAKSSEVNDERVTKPFHFYTCPDRKRKHSQYLFLRRRKRKNICLSTPLVVFFVADNLLRFTIESIISNINIIDSKVKHEFLCEALKKLLVLTSIYRTSSVDLQFNQILFLLSRKHLSAKNTCK